MSYKARLPKKSSLLIIFPSKGTVSFTEAEKSQLFLWAAYSLLGAGEPCPVSGSDTSAWPDVKAHVSPPRAAGLTRRSRTHAPGSPGRFARGHSGIRLPRRCWKPWPLRQPIRAPRHSARCRDGTAGTARPARRPWEEQPAAGAGTGHGPCTAG